MTLLKVLIGLAVLGNLGNYAAMFFAQTTTSFPARLVPPAGPLPLGAERIELAAPDGARLPGVLVPRAPANGAPR